MAKLAINRGSTANDGTGDNLRAGANKINLNFDEIYSAIGDGSSLSASIKVKDDSSTVSTIAANGAILGILGGSGISSTVSGSNVTLAVDGTISTASGTQTLTNKTINGPDNTLTNIANGSLANSSITVSDGSNTSPVNLGGTLTFAGTTNEIDVAENAGTITYGLPNNVTIAGNLTVNGTTTTVNSTTIEVTNSFTFEGTTSDDFETTLTVVDPTADRTVSIPNATGTIVLKDTTDTLTNKTISGSSNTLTNIPAANVTGVFDNTSSGHKLKFNFATTGDLPSSSTYEGMFAYDYGGNNAYVADAAGWVKLISENNTISDLSNVGSISGIADEEILVFRSSTGRFDPKPQKINAAVEIDVTHNGSGNYLFNSHYSGANPTLYLEGGKTYALNLAVTGHPFHLQTVSGAYSSGNAYSTGLTHHAADGTVTTGSSALLQQTGTLYIDVPSGSDTTIYYACQYHSSMAGSIILKDDTASAGASSGFAIAMAVAL